MFQPSDLQSSIQKAIDTGKVNIPDGHKIAWVTYGDLENKSIHSAIVENVGNNWQIVGQGGWSASEGFDAGFKLQWSK